MKKDKLEREYSKYLG